MYVRVLGVYIAERHAVTMDLIYYDVSACTDLDICLGCAQLTRCSHV